MTQSTESMIEVLQAYKDGKKIEYYNEETNEWDDAPNPDFSFNRTEYRIAPEPKKKVKFEAWLTLAGQLVWYDTRKVNVLAGDWIRVPSEDKEVEL